LSDEGIDTAINQEQQRKKDIQKEILWSLKSFRFMEMGQLSHYGPVRELMR
jgi:hypothetical protein